MRLLIFLIVISLAQNVWADPPASNPFFDTNPNNPGNANPSPLTNGNNGNANGNTGNGNGNGNNGNGNGNGGSGGTGVDPLGNVDPLSNTETIALGIYTNGDITSVQGSGLLSGRFNLGDGNSNLVLNNLNDVLNDIVKSGNEIDALTNSQILKVNGVVYSSVGTINLSISPISVGSTNFLPSNSISVKFTNISGLGEIDIAFNGNFFGLTNAPLQGSASIITNTTNISSAIDRKANFNLKGDVIEHSVSNVDDVGIYQGGITITVTCL